MQLRAGVIGCWLLAGCELVMGHLPPDPLAARLPDAGEKQAMDAGAGATALRDAGMDAGARRDAAVMLDAGSVRDARAADAGSIKPLDAGMTMRCEGGQALTLYRDKDGDGHGDRAATMLSCDPAGKTGWVRKGDDCEDDDMSVSPDQQQYFEKGYRSSSGAISFDYDCDGSELGAPGQDFAPDNCPGLLGLGLLCEGGGYAKSADRSAAPGVNAYCGSNIVTSCTLSGGLSCVAQSTTGPKRYACR